MAELRKVPSIGLQVVPGKPPWEAYLLPVTDFPIPEEELDPARRFLQRFSAASLQRWKLVAEVGFQVAQLHLKDGPSRLAQHGREWIPAVGLGVWPDREPPRGYTDEDFTELGLGEKPRELMYQVLRVTTTPEARSQGRDVMLGLGTVIQILVPDSLDEFFQRSTQTLLPPIQDPAFTCFPFFVPLLELKTHREATGPQLTKWLCGCSLYLRESAEDKGILILSREPLGPLLEELGGKLQTAPEPVWVVPC